MWSFSEPPLRNLPRALVWALKPLSLLFVLFAASFLALARLMLLQAGPLEIIGALIIYTLIVPALTRYLFLILERTANGHEALTPVAVAHFNPAEDHRLFLLLGLLVLAAAALVFGSPGLVAALASLAVLLLPAILLLLAFSGRVATALDPRAVARLVRNAGSDYFGPMAAALLCVSGVALMHLSAFAWLREILGMYLLVAGVRWLGDAAWESRDTIGLEPERSPERSAGKEAVEADKALDQALDRAYALNKTRDFDRALESVNRSMAALGGGPRMLEQVTSRLLAWEEPEVGLRLLRDRIGEAIRGGNTNAAWALYKRGLAADARFRPQRGDQAVALARHGVSAADHRSALALVEKFEQRYPDSRELLPVAAVLEARIVAEKNGRPDAARERLRSLCRAYPVCTDSDDVLSYLELLDSGL